MTRSKTKALGIINERSLKGKCSNELEVMVDNFMMLLS